MISRIVSLPRLAGNTGRVMRNLLTEMTHNHDLLRYNAFPIAVTLQSAMRLAQAHYSAYRERDTENGPFRYRQAVDATLREPLGIFAQYGLLRIVENFVKKRIDRYLGLAHTETQGLFSRLWSGRDTGKAAALSTQLYDVGRAWWRQTPGFEVRNNPVAQDLLVKSETLKKADEAMFRKNLVNRLPKLQKWLPMLRGKSADAAAKWLRTWVPLAVAAPISVGVAGYALEKFIRNYAGSIVSGLTRRMSGNEPSAPAAGQPVARGLAAPPAGSAATQYFNRIYQRKQLQESRVSGFNTAPAAFSRLG